jgi:chromosome segregation ATPase
MVAVAFIAILLSLWMGAESDVDSLQEELAAAEVENAELTAEVDHLEDELARVQRELTQSQEQLVATQGQLTTTESELTSAQAQVTSVQAEVEAAQQELSTAQADLANVRASAERCASGGQAFVTALNTLVEVNRRFENGQATDAELEAAALQGQAAYDAFVASCGIES